MAKVLGSNHRRIVISGMDPAEAAQMASAQAFHFVGDTGLFFTIASVISVSTPEVELVSDYNGAVAFDNFASYLIWGGFTPNFGLMEFAPNDVDIRDGMTRNFRIIDAEMTGGGGGGALTASGTISVTAAAVSKTITGTFPTPPYVALVTPNWLTGYSVRPGSKSTTQFIVDLSVPAPASAELDWAVV